MAVAGGVDPDVKGDALLVGEEDDDGEMLALSSSIASSFTNSKQDLLQGFKVEPPVEGRMRSTGLDLLSPWAASKAPQASTGVPTATSRFLCVTVSVLGA